MTEKKTEIGYMVRARFRPADQVEFNEERARVALDGPFGQALEGTPAKTYVETVGSLYEDDDSPFFDRVVIFKEPWVAPFAEIMSKLDSCDGVHGLELIEVSVQRVGAKDLGGYMALLSHSADIPKEG